MKIIINESQLDIFQRLVEGEVQLNDGNVKKCEGSEVGTSATITDSDGDPKNGKDVYTDEFAETQSNQNIWTGPVVFRRG